MKTATSGDAIKTITNHYIDGTFVESHGREVMDIVNPTNGKAIARVKKRRIASRSGNSSRPTHIAPIVAM